MNSLFQFCAKQTAKHLTQTPGLTARSIHSDQSIQIAYYRSLNGVKDLACAFTKSKKYSKLTAYLIRTSHRLLKQFYLAIR